MVSRTSYLLILAGWLAVPLGVLAATRLVSRRERKRLGAPPDVDPARLLCEAIGGPCDGRTWFLPEAAPIWLVDRVGRHLYLPLPETPGVVGARYRYGGLSDVGIVTPRSARVGEVRRGVRRW